MAQLFDRIRQAVAEDRIIISLHASDRLEERGIDEWQAVGGVADAELLRERPDDQPHPSVEVEQLLPDGTTVKAVWAWISAAFG